MVQKQHMTSDALHNKNAFNFLKQLRLPMDLRADLPQLDHYNEKYAYGTLYSRFMANLEAKVAAGQLHQAKYDDFFISLYKNNNKNLEETFTQIEPETLQKRPSEPPLEKTLRKKIQNKGPVLNQNTPFQVGSIKGRFFDMVYPYYKPSHQTSLATIREYAYNANKQGPQELRFGTQGQLHAYMSRVSPLFKRFLQAQQHKNAPTQITHIYFNNLAKDRSPWSFEGRFEMGLTKALHNLSEENIAVITLPADKGLMRVQDIADTTTHLDRSQVKKTLLEIALESRSVPQKIKDFHISTKLRQQLFENNDRIILDGLLNKSFEKLGLKDRPTLSPAQRQAVWVDFLKFELPRYIIEKLQPETYNFSCKDAIDRGGIASAYYNLQCSFKTEQPMTRKEFEQALHAAPVMVKGRGMNYHIKIIWNTIDQYLSAHPDLPKTQQWLIDWRDANCPQERTGELFTRRFVQCYADLKNVPDGLKLLDTLQTRFQGAHPQNHALFLDVLLATHNLCKQDKLSQEQYNHYNKIIDKIPRLYHPIADGMKKIRDRLYAMLAFTQQDKNHPFILLSSKPNDDNLSVQHTNKPQSRDM